MWPQAAHACSCGFKDEAGFIHAGVTELPSNARGAVFLPPRDKAADIIRADERFYIYSAIPRAVTPAMFTITSDVDKQPLPVEMTALTLTGPGETIAPPRALRFARAADQALFSDGRPLDWKAMLQEGRLIDISAQVQASNQMLRVGPRGGFKPGVRYTISYTGKADDWRHPATVEHAIAQAPLELAGIRYALQLDGPARRKPMSFPAGGSCAETSPSIVQEFHYGIPENHKRYAKALMYFSEKRDEGDGKVGTGFAPFSYQASMCAHADTGATARGNGADLVLARCSAAPGKVSVRGWVGLLEVEDRLRPTGVTVVDFGKATGRSCTEFGMLKEALAAGDALSIEETVCAASGLSHSALVPADIPPMTQLLNLASAGSATSKVCAKGALTALFLRAPVESGAYLDKFGKLLAGEIGSTDAKTAENAGETIYKLASRLTDSAAGEPDSGARASKFLAPVLPALLKLLQTGTPKQAELASSYIAALKQDAMALVTPLLATATSNNARAGLAAHALVGIIPADPRLHQILLRQAGSDALREMATLDYNEVAGASKPDKAIALLGEAARRGSSQAASALGSYGRRAKASVPALIVLMQKGKAPGADALDALLHVADGEPEVMAAFASMIVAPPEREFYSFTLETLVQLKQKGRVLLPAVEQRMQLPMSVARKAALKAVIVSMGLPRAQAQTVLKQLAQRTVLERLLRKSRCCRVYTNFA
jgi:hypothetical protein